MDAEAHQLFQAQLRCRILEAEKEAETIRADKYLNIILGSLGCEDGSGVTQPDASQVLHVATSVSARPTSPAASVCCPNLYREGVFMLTWMTPPVFIRSDYSPRVISRSLHGGQKAQFIAF